MESWTAVKTKKSKVKGKESEASETEEDEEPTKGRRKEKSRTPARRKGKPAKGRTYDTESSDGEKPRVLSKIRNPKDVTLGPLPDGPRKPTKNDSETDESNKGGTSSKHRRRTKEPTGNSKSKTRKYYAVARGYKPGVYKRYEEASARSKAFLDAKHKSFRTRTDAEKFVKTFQQAFLIGLRFLGRLSRLLEKEILCGGTWIFAGSLQEMGGGEATDRRISRCKAQTLLHQESRGGVCGEISYPQASQTTILRKTRRIPRPVTRILPPSKRNLVDALVSKARLPTLQRNTWDRISRLEKTNSSLKWKRQMSGVWSPT